MVHLGATVGDISTATGEVTYVPAFEVGTGWQYDVGKLGLAFHPDGLIYHKRQSFGPIGPHVPIGFIHSADKRATILVIHLNLWVAVCWILVLVELSLN
ncbi:hypothetical protein ES708_26157 [subsurface metagenome]